MSRIQNYLAYKEPRKLKLSLEKMFNRHQNDKMTQMLESSDVIYSSYKMLQELANVLGGGGRQKVLAKK